MRDDVKKPSAITTNMKLGKAFVIGNNSGTTKYQRNNCTNIGMFRNNSVQAVPINTKYLLPVVRKTPIVNPNTKATINPRNATIKVHCQALNSQVR